MSERLQLIHLGISGFPHNVTLAPIQKSYLIYKGLVETGADVLYINTIPQATPDGVHDDKARGSLDGIEYVYTGGTPYRSEGFLSRNWTKLKGAVNEIRLLLSLARQNKIDAGILYTAHFSSHLYYRFWSKLLGFPIIMNYVEYRSAFKEASLKKKIGWQLIDRYAPSLVDGILPISEFLIQHIKKQGSNTPYLKVPTLCDFSRYSYLEENSDSPHYFLYCGSAAYFEVANFIIASFELVEAPGVFLYLIVNGWPYQKEKINQRIEQSTKSNFIKTFSGVSNKEYSQLLFHAEGLLIPLRPTVQDTARFPNKIGEYVASGNPMVTTHIGEIGHYFEDGVSAFIAEEYEEAGFAQKMQQIIDHPHEAKAIGIQGQHIGHREFDYKTNGEKMISFLHQILGSRKLQKQ